MVQCQGHDTRKKADTECLNCKKPLCNSCLEIHLSIFDECGAVSSLTQLTTEEK